MGQMPGIMDDSSSFRQLTWLLCQDMWKMLTSTAQRLSAESSFEQPHVVTWPCMEYMTNELGCNRSDGF